MAIKILRISPKIKEVFTNQGHFKKNSMVYIQISFASTRKSNFSEMTTALNNNTYASYSRPASQNGKLNVKLMQKSTNGSKTSTL